MRYHQLENTVQEYAWGSVSAIPELLGVENPEGKPMAELWMGAHPKAPSKLKDDPRSRTLQDAVREEPDRFLGRRVAEEYGPELPFLFKVLASQRALSIQAHPDRSQAEEGFDREEREGIPIDASCRNYRDRNHKPEVLCALSEFHALCGFREPDAIHTFLSKIDAPLIGRALDALSGSVAGEASGLRGFFTTLLNAGDSEQSEAVQATVAAQAGEGGEARWVRELYRQFPDDIGVLAPLFLNLLTLEPGEAVYLDAGVLHAYLEGTGVELMANSDNVLRGGLTVKHVDVPELSRVLVFEPRDAAPVETVKSSSGVVRYVTPAEEFSLSVLEPPSGGSEAIVFPVAGPTIVLCTEGEGTILEGHGTSPIHRGESIFVEPAAEEIRLSGDMRLYAAAVPNPSR